MYYRSGLDDNTDWGAWVKLLDVNNYSSTLDSRYYTESEVKMETNEIINKEEIKKEITLERKNIAQIKTVYHWD